MSGRPAVGDRNGLLDCEYWCELTDGKVTPQQVYDGEAPSCGPTCVPGCERQERRRGRPRKKPAATE